MVRKFTLFIMSMIVLGGIVLPASANQDSAVHHSINMNHVEDDPYDTAYRDATASDLQTNISDVREKRQIGRLGIKLIEFIAKKMANPKHYQRVSLSATGKNVRISLSGHAVQRMAERGITGRMVDDVLSGKPTGIMHINKFDDVQLNSRVMFDPNSKLAVIIDKYSNTVISVYYDNDDSITQRQKSGRWKSAFWMFDHM